MADLTSVMGGQAFNSQTVEPSAPMEVMPKHWGTASITKSEMKPTGGGTGSMLVLEFTMIGGPYANRKVWHNLNLVNANAKAVEIAQRDLSAICRAVNRVVINNSDQLHGIPLDVLIDIEPATVSKDPQTGQVMLDAQGTVIEKYPARNKAGGFAVQGTKASASGAPGGAAVVQAQALAQIPAQQFAPQQAQPVQQQFAPVQQQPVQQQFVDPNAQAVAAAQVAPVVAPTSTADTIANTVAASQVAPVEQAQQAQAQPVAQATGNVAPPWVQPK